MCWQSIGENSCFVDSDFKPTSTSLPMFIIKHTQKRDIYLDTSLCLFTRLNKNWFPLKLTQQSFVIAFPKETQVFKGELQAWTSYNPASLSSLCFLRVFFAWKSFPQCLQGSRSGTTEVSLSSRQAGARSLVRRLSCLDCSRWLHGTLEFYTITFGSWISQYIFQRQVPPRNPCTSVQSLSETINCIVYVCISDCI